MSAEVTSTGAAMAGAPGPAASDHVPVFFVYIINDMYTPDAARLCSVVAWRYPAPIASWAWIAFQETCGGVKL
jgi:hypothetical protein